MENCFKISTLTKHWRRMHYETLAALTPTKKHFRRWNSPTYRKLRYAFFFHSLKQIFSRQPGSPKLRNL